MAGVCGLPGTAVVMGIAFGFAIGRSRAVSDLLLPSLELLRPIPAVVWIPLSILMFPSSELSMIYIGCSNVHRATSNSRLRRANAYAFSVRPAARQIDLALRSGGDICNRRRGS